MAIKWIDNEKEKMEKELERLRIENDVRNSMFADALKQMNDTAKKQTEMIKALGAESSKIAEIKVDKTEESPTGAKVALDEIVPTEFPTVEPITTRGFHDALYRDGKSVAEICDEVKKSVASISDTLERHKDNSRDALIDIAMVFKSIDAKLDTLIAKMPAQYHPLPNDPPYRFTCTGSSDGANPYIPKSTYTDADAGQSTNDTAAPPSADTFKEGE